MATSLFTSLFRRGPVTPPTLINFPYTLETNPYHCKRIWPPDFTQLSTRHQFRLERRYRRRTKLKWARPNWKKAVTLVQWASILFVAVYGFGYLETGKGRTVMDEIRHWGREQIKALEDPRARLARESKGGTESQKG
ncbi:hypothetical protein BAUCODRAFT_532755 [Baudoinia panamericana UAMH 10762]|uniref:Uncharacterized protein n=1 Tax=Baudoinia panamericana (strain UAMH 10762) TaxID=717646 RepID=M2N8S7_BAUPA|nr:uncharacterized protein BAUCODRAFT_532755 [Baudoinia panamericana UAMH 10762]EMC95240.1 hypothetical protein BAUCODRAFT_532755 [Baudoinia panamericana UAMH 10762]